MLTGSLSRSAFERFKHAMPSCAAGGLGAGSVLKADAVSLDGAVADPAAAAAAAADAAAKALRQGLVDQKQSAADFNAEEVPLSTCILQGTDYSEARSVKVCPCVPAPPACCAMAIHIQASAACEAWAACALPVLRSSAMACYQCVYPRSPIATCLPCLWWCLLWPPCSPQDIAAEFWAGRGRERKQRLITVDGFQVLRENNYTLNEARPCSQSHPRTCLISCSAWLEVWLVHDNRPSVWLP